MTSLYVSIFDPLDPRDAGHWTLFLSNAHQAFKYQYGIVDDGDTYFIDGRSADPQRSAKHSRNILIGTIPDRRLRDAQTALNDPRSIDNESNYWNCQNWVMNRAVRLVTSGFVEVLNNDWSDEMEEANAADDGNQREFAEREAMARQGRR